MKNRVFKVSLLFIALLVGFTTVLNASTDVRGAKKTSKIYKVSSNLEGGAVGDAWAISINNIHLPYNRKGVIADVNYGTAGSLGRYPGPSGKGFLFSSGFFLSGYKEGQLFANAVASASLVEDYLQGTVADGANDSRAQIYVVSATDEPFGAAWQAWSDAVELGADFYDGDGDGQYTPVDKNGNGEWDTDEDRPDLIGDETGWTVYHDGVAAGTRRWNTVNPVGIEIRQTIFGFASAGAIGNILFVRYRFTYAGLNNGTDVDQLDNVYFGVWADPDIGGTSSAAADDLVGSDIERNAGYVYNDGPDDDWGNNPPAFIIDFFSGPAVYIPGETFTDVDGDGEYTDGVDLPLDTAYSIQGQVKGVQEFPGAKNLGISSFVEYINGDPLLRDPSNAAEARNFMEGKVGITGEEPDPCNWAYGDVLGGVDCATVNPNIWYNGDPVTQTGWINTAVEDQRMMSNTGPFVLKKGEEKEIMVAYVVGQGSSALNSITEARRIDDGAQFIFDNNFLSPAPPPAVNVSVETSDDFIDLIWETPRQVGYTNLTDAYDLYFEGYNVWTYKSRTTQPVVGSEQNVQLYRRYSLDNQIVDIYQENSNTGGIELMYQEGSVLLDPEVYTDPDLGKIRVRITRDPWTGASLIKGKPYYFAVTSYALNYAALVNKETGTPGISGKGDYYLSSNAFVGAVENTSRIIEVIVGSDIYVPPLPLVDANYTGSKNSGVGMLGYDVVDKESLTGDTYSVSFFVDKEAVLDTVYVPYWKLTNETTGAVLVDSSKSYTYGDDQINLLATEGFITRISSQKASLSALQDNSATPWISSNTEALYVSPDLGSQSRNITTLPGPISSRKGSYIQADKLRRVELRFGGGGGKAYRYINGYVGSVVSKNNSYVYAEGVPADPTIGKPGEGFVDVPFTAWVKDPVYGEERQLAVGFIERAPSATGGGNPDGEWNPGTNIANTAEFILVFNADYDPNGNQQIYKGFDDGSGNMIWADLRGGSSYNIPDGAVGATEDDKLKAASTFFDALYVFRVEYADTNSSFSDGDILVKPVATYPYTSADSYSFKTNAQGALSSAQEKELFDKVNVFPNPLFGFNPATSWTGQAGNPDEPFVTFSNLPEEITIKIYSLSGQLLNTLGTDDKDTPTSPFLRWNLTNQDGLRVASGLYLAIVSSPKYGDKVLKFSVILPQKQLQKY
ncbi:MAG: hypothetical protein C4543_05020 [Ignavibacteriales bacterium]|jgi:hypothetical protein|nr:MAG: hypothetical protein C4543_05020 [Ignavibacteriales bacterium]